MPGKNGGASRLISSAAGAGQSMGRLRAAQETVSAERNRIAAFQGRLQQNAATASSILGRLQSSEVEVREADAARSVTALTRSQ